MRFRLSIGFHLVRTEIVENENVESFSMSIVSTSIRFSCFETIGKWTTTGQAENNERKTVIKDSQFIKILAIISYWWPFEMVSRNDRQKQMRICHWMCTAIPTTTHTHTHSHSATQTITHFSCISQRERARSFISRFQVTNAFDSRGIHIKYDRVAAGVNWIESNAAAKDEDYWQAVTPTKNMRQQKLVRCNENYVHIPSKNKRKTVRIFRNKMKKKKENKNT